jgi:hypothetical protein
MHVYFSLLINYVVKIFIFLVYRHSANNICHPVVQIKKCVLK